MSSEFDAVVVGSGPNGLAAAITLAQAGARVLVIEGAPTVGGGMRTQEITLPGFRHDICSAVHPLGLASPVFSTYPLAGYGLEWVQPEIPAAHPLDGGRAALLHRSVDETATALGEDGAAWRSIVGATAEDWPVLAPALLSSLPLSPHLLALARFGLNAVQPATLLARTRFRTELGRALFAGLAAHSIQPLHWPLTASFGMLLGALGHYAGWPLPRGGSQALADALAAYLRSLGGEIVTDTWVRSLDELPPARVTLLDVSPRALLEMAGERLPAAYRRELESYRYGAGVFKLDYALSGPAPWANPDVARAGTVHLGGALEEVAAGEAAVGRGHHPERPYVLVAQPSLFDGSRAPAGRHTLWAYCHVPNGSTVDMTEAVEGQIERFAPGFKDLILGRAAKNTAAMEAHNPNYVGGDINVGVQNWRQLWTRPAVRLVPYATPVQRLYLCSSATPPGGGVHGMCGYHAARAALRAWL